MNLEKVQKFIKLAKAEGVAELKYEEKDLKISVNFNTTSVAPAQIHSRHNSMDAAQDNIKAADPNVQIITSPFVGTFYSQPSPGKPSYVKSGDTVSVGQTLCILEAMKIMNEIESEVSGEIIEICVENENLVEFGQPLFKVRV